MIWPYPNYSPANFHYYMAISVSATLRTLPLGIPRIAEQTARYIISYPSSPSAATYILGLQKSPIRLSPPGSPIPCVPCVPALPALPHPLPCHKLVLRKRCLCVWVYCGSVGWILKTWLENKLSCSEAPSVCDGQTTSDRQRCMEDTPRIVNIEHQMADYLSEM